MSLAIQCPPLALTDTNLSCTVSSYKFGGIAQCACGGDQMIKGNYTLHCGEKGNWSGSVPICQSIVCTEPPIPQNGFILNGQIQVQVPKASYNTGEIVIFGCENGYMMTENDFVVCQRNGQWSK